MTNGKAYSLWLLSAVLCGLLLTYGLVHAQARADTAKTARWRKDATEAALTETQAQLTETRTTLAITRRQLTDAQRTIKQITEAMAIREHAVAFLMEEAEARMLAVR